MSADERAAKVREKIAGGATQAAVAEDLGVSVSTVQKDLKRKPEAPVERVKQAASTVVEKARKAVHVPKIPASRLELRTKQHKLICMRMRGEQVPRGLRREAQGNMTGDKAIKIMRATIAGAGIDPGDTLKLERAVWDHIEAEEAEKGRRA